MAGIATFFTSEYETISICFLAMAMAVDHDTDAGRMIEKLVEDYLKKYQTFNWVTPMDD
jgi:hypothetical protein